MADFKGIDSVFSAIKRELVKNRIDLLNHVEFFRESFEGVGDKITVSQSEIESIVESCKPIASDPDKLVAKITEGICTTPHNLKIINDPANMAVKGFLREVLRLHGAEGIRLELPEGVDYKAPEPIKTGLFEGQFHNPLKEGNPLKTFREGDMQRTGIKLSKVALGAVLGKAAYNRAFHPDDSGETHKIEALMYAVPATLLIAGGLLLRGQPKMTK